MSQFNVFKEWLDKEYQGDIYTFIDDCSDIPFNGRQLENNDERHYDSYGYEDSSLERVYIFPDLDNLYIKFTGSRQSYDGENWTGMVEVVAATKTVEYFEEIK